MKDPKAIRKAIMTAKSIASLIDPKFARVPLPDIGLPAPDMVVPEHSMIVHSAYDVPMPQKYAAGGDVEGRDLNQFGLYSHASEQAGDLARQDSPENYRNMLLKRGVKPAELEWSGYDKSFANQPQITRDQVVEHFQKNMPDLYETQYGSDEAVDEARREMKNRHVAERLEYIKKVNEGARTGDLFDEDRQIREDMHKRHGEELAGLGKGQFERHPFHEDYTVSGGKNYREVLVQHNSFGGFEGVPGHFGGAPDIISSLRLKDREDHEGDKVLHLEELQSDWGQQGRQKGFDEDAVAKREAAKKEYNDFLDKLAESEVQRRVQSIKEEKPYLDMSEGGSQLQMLRDIIGEGVYSRPHEAAKNAGMMSEFKIIRDAYNEAIDADHYRSGVKKAAYVTKTDDWVDLGLKRALLEAAKGGYDKLAWSPGDVHADRYDLSKHIGEIRHEKNDDGTYNLDVYGKDGSRVFDRDDMSKDDLADHVGKEMAEKIIAGHGEKDEDPGYRDWRTISGLDLKVGGEGMRKFYDEMLPKRLMKLAKQHEPETKLETSHTKGDEWPYPISIGGDDGDYHLYGHDARGEGSTRGILASGFKTYGEADDARQRFLDGYHTSLPAIKITPRMRESILKKGFAAYADGGEVEGYASGGDIDPEKFREHLKRIYSPLSEDPEIVRKALQIAGSYRAPIGMETGTGSLYSVKQSMPASAVTRTIGDIPGVSLKPKVKGSWEDFYNRAKGNMFVNVGGDLSGFGRLTHINEKELAWPVDLHAGADYMREPNRGRVWANVKAHATSYKNKIREAEEQGKELYGVLSPMGASAVNSSHNMFDALMAQIPNAGIDKKHIKEFDEAIKRGDHIDIKVKKNPELFKEYLEKLKQWPGLENAKEVSEFARPENGNLNGGHRADIVKFMDKADWLKKGFPEVGVTRAAITNPDLMGAGGNKMGYRVVKFSSSEPAGGSKIFKHSTYPEDTFGEYVMDVPLTQRHYVQPDAIERMVMSPTKSGQIVHPYSEDAMGRSTARKLFEEQKQLQPVNQRFLDSVMTGMENQEKYGFKAGGSVRKALMIAKGVKKK